MKLKTSKIDLIVLKLDMLINYSGLGVQLNRSSLVYLAYLYLYGFEGRDKIIEDGVSLNKGVWSNKLNEFREMGFVTGKSSNSKVNFTLDDSLNIQIDVEVTGEGS